MLCAGDQPVQHLPRSRTTVDVIAKEYLHRAHAGLCGLIGIDAGQHIHKERYRYMDVRDNINAQTIGKAGTVFFAVF